jgi:trehalose 6-phosphate phosphatase
VESASLIARFAAQPELAAVLLDVDGTLAPIVDRPEDAAVPETTREVLRELASRYALVACVSGRVEDDARRVVGLDEVVYVGEHGMGLDPHAGDWGDALELLLLENRLGARTEALLGRVPLPNRRRRGRSGHDPAQGRAPRARARPAPALGPERCSRCSRPSRRTREPRCARCSPSAAAPRALCRRRRTDLEAFRGLDGLDVAVRVAVVSDEGPSALGEAADLVVGSTEALVELLRQL